MRLRELDLRGVFVVEPERLVDERGWFARTYSREEFAAAGIDAHVEQTSWAYNERRHTLRGLHYQTGTHAETKLVRCTSGEVYDVVADLRADSPTYCCWRAIHLTARGGEAVVVPPGVAHGYLTLTDGAELQYQMSTRHQPSSASGLRWDDPALRVSWPHQPDVVSERDLGHPPFRPAQPRGGTSANDDRIASDPDRP